jgi:hypothetical protein
MSEIAIGASIHKATRSLVRVVPLTLPNRLYATRDSAGLITLPTLPTGQGYVNMPGVTKLSFQIDDREEEFNLFGDNGWVDSVTVGSRVTGSGEVFFMRNIEVSAGASAPVFQGDYSEDFAIIERSRYDKDFEVYIEFLKEMGRAQGTSGDFVYDYAGFNGVFRGYNDPNASNAGLTKISFNLMSRSEAVFGRYISGPTPLPIGEIQSTQLATAPSSGTRRWATSPVDNASAVAVSAAITVTYTSDGTAALTQLALPPTGGGGFRLENASSGVQILAGVSLASNVVTITPAASLPAATILRLRVADGAIQQSVDASNNASVNGVRKPLQGFATTFRTA